MGAPARPDALLDWKKPEWLYLAAISGFIFLLIIRRIALYLIDHSLRGSRKSGTRSDLRLHPTRWHNIVFGYEAFQTKYLNRPAICRIAGLNIFGCLDWAEVIMILLLYLINILLIVVRLQS
jgi:hypothetical protein